MPWIPGIYMHADAPERLCICSSTGQKEELCDKLRSVLSQVEYTHQICTWESKGISFKSYFNVPKIHPVTMAEFHDASTLLESIGRFIIWLNLRMQL